jgi:peptide/nickel transport system substrate-binding protein/oligopeptide transport system substrate-binding protein
MISTREASLRRLLPLLALVLAGCPGPGPAPPPSLPAEAPAPMAPVATPPGRVFHLRGGGVTADLYPANCPTVTQGAYVRQVYEGLVTFDEDLRITPALAESWKISDDLQTYTFTLRKGLTFHDGSPLEAAAVVRSFEHYARHAGEWFWVVDPILGARAFRDDARAERLEGIRALDPLTVEVRLVQPDGIFLVHLAMPQAAIYKALPPGGAFAYCGAGPWRNLEAGPGGVAIGPFAQHHAGVAPGVDRVVYGTDGPLGEAWTKGSLDLAAVGEGEAGLVPASELKVYPGLETEYAAFVPGVPLPVRQLVNRVLDREAFCKTVLEGLAEPSHGVIPPGIRGAHAEPRRFDAGEAPVLAEKFRLNATLEPRLFATLAAALKPHGVVLVSDPKKPWQLMEHGWIADYPDPDDYLRILFHSKSGTLNVAGYSNPEVDALLEKGRAMSADLEDDARLDLYRKIEDRIVADVPWLFLWHRKNRIAVKPRVSGVRFCALDANGALTLEQTRLSLGPCGRERAALAPSASRRGALRDLLGGQVLRVRADGPRVAEGVREGPHPVAVELVGDRPANRGALVQRPVHHGVHVLGVEEHAHGVSLPALRSHGAHLGVLVGEHEESLADPDLRVHDLPAGALHAHADRRAERLLVEVDRPRRSVDDQVGDHALVARRDRLHRLRLRLGGGLRAGLLRLRLRLGARLCLRLRLRHVRSPSR